MPQTSDRNNPTIFIVNPGFQAYELSKDDKEKLHNAFLFIKVYPSFTKSYDDDDDESLGQKAKSILPDAIETGRSLRKEIFSPLLHISLLFPKNFPTYQIGACLEEALIEYGIGEMCYPRRESTFDYTDPNFLYQIMKSNMYHSRLENDNSLNITYELAGKDIEDQNKKLENDNFMVKETKYDDFLTANFFSNLR